MSFIFWSPDVSSDSRTSGVPSVRTDLPVPRVRTVGDSTNYSDTATASELLQPSVYDLHGVDEEQLLRPRSRKEVDGSAADPWSPSLPPEGP